MNKILRGSYGVISRKAFRKVNNQNYEILKNEWKNVCIETEHLRIRNYKETDENGFFSIFQDDKTMKMDNEIAMKEKGEEFYRRISMIKEQTLIFLCLSDRTTDDFIGYVLLNNYPIEQDSTITIGCSLVPDCQSKGYGYEAISKIISCLKSSTVVNRVLANAILENTPSLGLIKKLGFTYLNSDENDKYFSLDL